MTRETPHFHGHRKRLRDRFKKTGLEGVADYELIELMLTLIIPRKDVKPLAKEIMKKYGNLKLFLDSMPSTWTSLTGVSDLTVANLLIIRGIVQTYILEKVQETIGPIQIDDLAVFWQSKIGSSGNEVVQAGYLDTGLRLLKDGIENVEEGTIDRASVYPRKIVESALKRGASAVVIAHNHPNGNPEPTEQDKLITRALVLACQAVQLKVIDHLIVTPNQHFSFKKAGLL